MAHWVITDGNGTTWLEVTEDTRARLVSDEELAEAKRTGLPPLGFANVGVELILDHHRGSRGRRSRKT